MEHQRRQCWIPGDELRLRAARRKRAVSSPSSQSTDNTSKTHQLPSDVEGDNDEGEDQECAADEEKRRRFMNKRKLGRKVGKAERVERRGSRHICNHGHGL